MRRVVGSPLLQLLVNPDLRRQRFVQRAAPRDAEELLALLGGEGAAEADLHVEAVDVAAGREAVGAVLGVHAVVDESDLHAFEGDLLALRVEMQGHRRAGAEARGQEVVRRRAFAASTSVDRLVADEPVRADFDLVAEGARRAGAQWVHRHNVRPAIVIWGRRLSSYSG